jgi:co-chaperonin GroES (HSP10)
MSIKLLLHHLLIDPDKKETVSPGGIVIPDQILEKERKAVEYGTVVQVGPTAYLDHGRDPSIINIGDRVCLNRYSGKEVLDKDDKKYLIINDSDILCVIE